MRTRTILSVVAAVAMLLASGTASAQYGAGGVIYPNAGAVNGMVTPGMALDPSSNRPYIDYVLNVTAPGQYQIDLISPNSSAYDPYLYLLQGGRQIASNDDGGGYPNARISQFLAPGTYIVRVSSFRSGPMSSVAPYSLSVQGGPPVYSAPPPPPVVMGGQALMVNIPINGMFLPSFPITGEGRPYMDYVFTVSYPGMYQVDLRSVNSSAYDPYLYLMQNGVVLDTNDDGGGYPNSRITRFLAPGTYVARVSSFRRGAVGPAPYVIQVTGR